MSWFGLYLECSMGKYHYTTVWYLFVVPNNQSQFKKIIVFRGFLYLVDLIFYVYISLSTIFLLSYAIASNTGCFPLPTVLLSKFPVIQLYFNNQRTFLPQERENVQTSRNKVKFYKDPNIRNRFRQNLSV